MTDNPDKWLAGDAYQSFMGHWSRQVAQEFLQWLNPPASRSWSWLEVGCGTGALTQAIFLNAYPAAVVACDPTPQLLDYARRALLHPAVTFLQAGADDLPQLEGGFDAVVSGLVLNFLPDPAGALRLMRSRLHPGGLLAAYVWDYAAGMQLLRIFWQAVVELDPGAAAVDERQRFPICRPDALVALWEGAGLGRVRWHELVIATPFPDFDSYWDSFLGGTGPAPAYVASLTPDARQALRQRLSQRLAPAGGPLLLTARAWAVRGYADAPGLPSPPQM